MALTARLYTHIFLQLCRIRCAAHINKTSRKKMRTYCGTVRKQLLTCHAVAVRSSVAVVLLLRCPVSVTVHSTVAHDHT
jgi:hypothetical protein